MDKELILVTALTDVNVADVVKKCILEMPLDCFKKSITKRLFKHLKDTKDILDLDSDELNKISECIKSDVYKVFSGSNVVNQMPTVEAVLDVYRKEKITLLLEEFNLKMLQGGYKVQELTREFIVKSAGLPSIERAVSAAEATESLMEYVKNTIDGTQVPVISTGFRCLDDCLDGGFGDGDVIVVTAPSGEGKTTFIQNVLNNILYENKEKKVLYLTSEMKPEQLIQKFMCIEAYNQKIPGVSFGMFRQPPADFYEKLTVLGSIVSNYNVDFQWCTNPNDLAFYMNRKDYDVVCMDHIHDLKGMDGTDSNAIAADVMHEFKEWAIAGEFRTCIVLAQPRKKGTDRGASTLLVKDDVKGAQAIQAKASIMLSVRRDEENNSTYIDTLKNRYGTCNKSAPFKFDEFSGKYIDPSNSKNRRR